MTRGLALGEVGMCARYVAGVTARTPTSWRTAPPTWGLVGRSTPNVEGPKSPGAPGTFVVALADRYAYRPDLVRRLERLQSIAEQSDRRAESSQPGAPRSLRFRLTAEHRQALVDDYGRGVPTTRLTLRYGLSKGAVLGLLREADVAMRKQPLTSAEVDQSVRLYESGQSLAQIAARFHTGATTVNRALRTRGVRLRSRQG